MPQLIAIALLGAGAWLAYRWMQKEAAKLARNIGTEDRTVDSPASGSGKDGDFETEPQSSKASRNREAETLEYDPETGVYQPKE